MSISERPAALSRRAFGTGSLGLVAAAVVGGAQAQQPVKTFAIDTHAHVFHRELKLADVRRYAPAYDAPLDLYLKQLDTNGMSHGVLVQPSFLGTDNSYIVDCLKAAHGRLRGICVVEPDVSVEELKRLDGAGVVGLRLNLTGKPRPGLAVPQWQALLAQAAKLNWQVEVLRAAGDLATLAPVLLASGVNVVIDHFGVPDPAKGVNDPGFVALTKLGASRRLWIKVSAPYRLGAEGERIAREAYPLLRDGLGIDRLLWGSDWPHTNFESVQTYEKNLAAFRALVSDKAEQATILANPRGLFRFG